MTDDREPSGTERAYREAQEETGQYLDLIREYLEEDVAQLASTGKFDKAIEDRFASLIALGRLDRDIRHGITRAGKRGGDGIFARLGWVGPFALGIIVATIPFLLAPWGRGAPDGGSPTLGESQVAAQETTQAEVPPSDTGRGNEGLGSEVTPEQVIAVFDARFPEDSAWFGGLLSGLRDEASEELDDEIGLWLSGEPFDTVRVRSGMALWVLAGNGWPLHLDGVYGPDCTGTNCPTMRNAWVSALDLDVSDFVPYMPAGTAWSEPAEALAPFEKFLIVQHILHNPPNG